jgi:hypothetical protein
VLSWVQQFQGPVDDQLSGGLFDMLIYGYAEKKFLHFMEPAFDRYSETN